MNDIGARSIPVVGGYQGQLRKVHRSEWEPVCVNGNPQVYPTAEEAELAAWRALKAHLVGEIVGTGEKASAAAAEAEFRKIFRKGKVVEVVRK